MRSDGEVDRTRHHAGALTWAWDVRLRDECWAALDEWVRTRLTEDAGEVIDWWAHDDGTSGADGRPAAVVLGRRGLCVATPTPAGEPPGYAFSGYLLDPGSMRPRSIEHRPDRSADSAPTAAVATPATRPIDIGLSDDASGLLGHLPPRAQAFLQGPFVTGQRVADCAWYYEGDERRFDVFIVYLAGEHDVTFATGTKVIPPGHAAATAHWSLACHQATVIGRRGG